MSIIQKTDEFLRRMYVHPELTNIDATRRDFMEEIDRGLMGEGSSLAMIPAYISPRGLFRENEPVIAIDAGGTNLRVALVTFRNGRPVTEHLEKHPIPGSRGEVTAEEFFEYIARLILPLTEYSDKVGFCFSYAIEITPGLDGIIGRFNKELRVRGAEGMHIGVVLNRKLKELGLEKPLRFVLINDTVGSLMGGIANLGLEDSDGLAGLILGTGSNLCYAERGEAIGKLPDPRDMLINCESGNFSRALRGEPDKRVDTGSIDPGNFTFEKMMSGAYMGKLFTETVLLAAEEGLVSEGFRSVRKEPFTSHETDSFLRGAENRISDICIGQDREVLVCISDRLFERSAKLVCASIAGLCVHCDGGKTPETPFTVVAEGTMFWDSLLFYEKLKAYISEYIEKELGRYVRICRADNATLAGAALSALLNL